MRINVTLPCCGEAKSVPASRKPGEAVSMVDRKCSHCGCWWRVDSKCLSADDDKLIHSVELTRVGQLKKEN